MSSTWGWNGSENGFPSPPISRISHNLSSIPSEYLARIKKHAETNNAVRRVTHLPFTLLNVDFRLHERQGPKSTESGVSGFKDTYVEVGSMRIACCYMI